MVGTHVCVVMLHAIPGRKLNPLELFDDLYVVGGTGTLNRTQEFFGTHIAVVVHIARSLHGRVRIHLAIALDEFLYSRKIQIVVPRGAENTEQVINRQAVDIRPVLLVVDPGRLFSHAHLGNLLAHHLRVIPGHGGRHHVRLDLLDFQKIGGEVPGALGH